MNRVSAGFLIMSTAGFVVSCQPLFEIYKGDTQAKGIPFYAKTAKCEHSTVYIFPFYLITYQTLLGDKVQTTETVFVNDLKGAGVSEFLGLLRDKNPPGPDMFKKANEAWNKIKTTAESIDPYNKLSSAKLGSELYLVANTANAKIVVDYDSPYALNARAPLIGTVNATYELNSDGTLSKGGGQVEDKTVATILGFISETLKTAASTGVLAFDAEKQKTLQASIEKRALKLTYSKMEKFNVGCDVTTRLDSQTAQYFLIEEISGKEAKDDGKSKSNEITLTGKITLPEPPKKEGGDSGTAGASKGATKSGGEKEK